MKKIFIIAIVLLLLAASMISIQRQVTAATPRQTTYEPFPTATAYTTPEAASKGTYTNGDYGITITIPDEVTTVNSAPDSGLLQEYTFGNNEAFGYLYPGTKASGESLKDVAQGAFDSESNGLDDIEILTDEELKLPNGETVWYTQFTGYEATNGYTLEVRIFTVVNKDRAIMFEIYSLPENFSAWEKTIAKMRDSISMTAPTVLGVPRDQVLILESGESSNPLENDPATMHGTADYLIFEGLVSYNDKMEIVPSLAAGWDVTNNGTVYTFHLQPYAVFHNGKPFTAQDVVYSWERAVNPATKSDTVMTYLNDIVGVKEMHEGNADHISGLKVIDDHTLQVTLDAPKAYFLYKLTFSTAMILDQQNVETGTDWYRTPNGTGPYRLVRWDSMEKMIYERFENYYGTLPAISKVLYTLYTGDSFRLYEEGSVDFAGVPDYNADRVKDPSEPLNKELVTAVSLCTTYIQFDVTKPPFDDVKVRQAFAISFDKNKYLEVVLKNTDVAARGLYPPALPGYNLDLKGLEYNPDRARKLIAESKYGSVDAFPEIVFTSSGWGSYSDSLISAMSQMWQQNLGVTITVQNLDPEKYYDTGREKDFGQLSTSGWCADYPDPENFADVLFHTGTEMNKGNYSNPELDALLEKARIEPDVNKRIGMYQQAEQMIVDDAAAIFLYHSTSYVVVKPYIKGYILAPVSSYPLIRYLSIDPAYWQ